jgi:hypothetical protein
MTDDRPFMTGNTTVETGPPYGFFEYKYELVGYPDTRIDVEVFGNGVSIGKVTLTSQAPTGMITPSGPKLTADFKNMQLTYADYEYLGGELVSTTIGTVADWQTDTQFVQPPGEVVMMGVESSTVESIVML